MPCASCAPGSHPPPAETRPAPGGPTGTGCRRRPGRYEDRSALEGPHLQLDGYSTDPYGEDTPITASACRAARMAGEPEPPRADPWEESRPDDWVLLAQWHGTALIDGDIHWTIARKDVRARRFDHATVLSCFEGP
ncbi:hypothetical protein [Streptomyces sp. HPH0547]|uniref:hypothetical protein n=1 Tax=unclassified Streptomyces TaxID=2593676 RepID=UPI0012B99EE2|nr:hypothetical protein [Streptomyces sp. HPH0547]